MWTVQRKHQLLVHVDLGQGVANSAQDGRQRQLRRKTCGTAGPSPAQLVHHDVVHAGHLQRHHGRQFSWLIERGAQCCQRCFKAVGQIVQRIFVTCLPRPFLVHQAIEALGQTGQLSRICSANPRLLAFFNVLNFPGHAAKRGQRPAQQSRLRQQQKQPGATQPAPQRALKGLNFLVKNSLVFKHRKNQRRHPVVHRPLDRIAGSQVGAR